MDDIIRNLAPPVGGLLIALYAWLEVRRMHRKLHRPPRPRPAWVAQAWLKRNARRS